MKDRKPTREAAIAFHKHDTATLADLLRRAKASLDLLLVYDIASANDIALAEEIDTELKRLGL